MTFELVMLCLAALLFMVLWIPPSIAKYRQRGVDWVAHRRVPEEGLAPLRGWGNRAKRAHDNYKENFPPFVVAVLVLAYLDGFTSGTAAATAVFLAGRILHPIVYIAGWVWPRTVSWAAGYLATLYLYYVILSGAA